jgi:starch-binding outer membrane protein, SusD/RagB family
MKKIKYILCLGVIALLAACNSLLETTPKSGIVSDASFFKTTADFDAFMMGAYIDVGGSFDGYGIANWIKVTHFISQEAWGPDQLNKPLAQYMTASNDQITNFWKCFYSMAAKANLVLSKLADSKIAAEDKTRLEGEALFFRGFAYFSIARAYGNAPLLLTPYDLAQNTVECTSESVIWDQVIQDLSAAATKLPTKTGWGSANIGRVSKGTAFAFLANAYMYKEDWTNAEIACNSLLDLNEYSLMPNVRSVFSLATPNNAESIWEVQYRDIPNGKINWSGHEAGSCLPEYNSPRNIGNEWAPAAGWGELVGTRKLADSFEPGDDRRAQLLKVPGEKYKGETMTDTLTIPFTITQVNSCFPTKYWLGPTPLSGADYLFGTNVPVMRFAEFMLNYSEILFMNDKTTEAYAQLNAVRERALLTDLDVQSNQDTFIDQLMNERRHELNFEPNLWFHYTRTKTAAKFLLDEYGVTMEPKWYKLPVPQAEKDQNPNLCQNDGY